MKFSNIKIQKLSGVLLIGIFAFNSTLSLRAQTQPKDTALIRTVVVEQEYNPDIMDARKVNVLPKVEEITVSPNVVQYDGAIAPAANIPAASMSAYAGKEIQPNVKPGYVRLGYGNNGNLDARLNYLFQLSGKDKLNLAFGMDGMDAKLDMIDRDGKWNSYYYRTRAGLNYLHQFGKTDLDIAGNFGLSNFNLLPLSNFGRQKFTSGDVHLGLKSTDDSLPLQFKAETNLLLYSRSFGNIDDGRLNETILRTKADVTGEISQEQRVGVAVTMNNFFYNSKYYENYTSLLLNPYYTWAGDAANVRLGANIDLSVGYGKAFRISPDISAAYNFGQSYQIYAKATGGKRHSDLRAIETFNPYGELDLQLEDTYNQVDASVGLKASPVAGLWISIYGGYQNIKNELFANEDIILYLPSPDGSGSGHGYFYEIHTANMNNINAGFQLLYDYKSIFSIVTRGKYTNWSDHDDYAFLLKPMLELDFALAGSPLPGMNVELGYRYVQHVQVKLYAGAGGSAVNDINNLYANFSYQIFDGVSLYARASNLLNKKYSYYYGYPSQGINFLGGLSFRF